MARKNALAMIRSRQTLDVAELHAVSREAALAAANREADSLSEALELIERAEAVALAVSETATPEIVRADTRAATIALAGATAHLRAAIKSLSLA